MATRKRRQPSRAKPSTAAVPKTSSENSYSYARKAHYTRPGVEAAARLASLSRTKTDPSKAKAWVRALSRYPDMIKAKGGARLLRLDEERGGVASGWEKTGATLSKAQLLDVMIEWKFGKGKPRNALKPLLKSNGDESVATAARKAFEAADAIPAPIGATTNDIGKHAPQISAAIGHLCDLKGVGPATASCVLCLYRPDAFAFMDDEVIECLYEKKRGYTLKIYLEVNDRCGDIAAVLNDAAVNEGEWTACKVGKALWTVATMSAMNDEDGLAAIFAGGDDGDNRSRALNSCGSNEENEGSSSNLSRKRAKKL